MSPSLGSTCCQKIITVTHCLVLNNIYHKHIKSWKTSSGLPIHESDEEDNSLYLNHYQNGWTQFVKLSNRHMHLYILSEFDKRDRLCRNNGLSQNFDVWLFSVLLDIYSVLIQKVPVDNNTLIHIQV